MLLLKVTQNQHLDVWVIRRPWFWDRFVLRLGEGQNCGRLLPAMIVVLMMMMMMMMVFTKASMMFVLFIRLWETRWKVMMVSMCCMIL
jgi:hypothetical protein